MVDGGAYLCFVVLTGLRIALGVYLYFVVLSSFGRCLLVLCSALGFFDAYFVSGLRV